MSSTGSDGDEQRSEASEDDHVELSQANKTGNHDGDDSPEEAEREGRFYGPDSSWRHYTQAERDLAATLDQAENNDLSIHLYNAHAWKRQHRDFARFENSKPWHSKQRWIKLDENGKLPFLPDRGWTAWPMRPEDVPRSREHWGVPVEDLSEEDGTYSKQQNWRPSLHLQEELQAVVLRKAKERFFQRRWTVAKSEQTSSKQRRHSEGSDSYTAPQCQKEEIAKSEEEQKAPEGDLPGTKPSTQYYIPVFTADDEAAGKILKPTVNHIISQLDKLLIGLHKSRQGHRKEPGAPRGRSASRSRSRPAGKRKRVASDANQIMADVDSDHSERSRSRSRHRALGLRDWSEVLGVAALTGWNQEALDRTAKRCAALFGETMSMRIMMETSASNQRDEIIDYTPDLIPELDSLSEEDEEEEDEASEDGIAIETESITDDGKDIGVMTFNCCPFTDCERHQKPYPKRWRLNEHLKRKHDLSNDEIGALEAKSNREEVESSDDEAPMKIERGQTEDEEDEMELLDDAVMPAVRRDGFLETINVRLRPPKRKREKVESESESDSEEND